LSIPISGSATTQFSLTILESTGLWPLTNTRVTFGISFGDDFGVGRGLVFIDYFQVNRGCARLGIQASPSEVVSLTFSKSTGAASASESTRHL
jgi:hypothetical protein